MLPTSITSADHRIHRPAGASSNPRNNKKPEFGWPARDSSKAMILLAVACLWPLFILALFASSAPHVNTTGSHGPPGATVTDTQSSNHHLPGPLDLGNIKFNIRKVLDRVDVLGYGPTHPRLAVVIVGHTVEAVRTSMESVFLYTDLARIFLVVAVLDGVAPDETMRRDLQKIDHGAIPHWHGNRPDLHGKEDKSSLSSLEDDSHGRKVHVMFNEQPLGVAACRADAIDFITVLQQHHEAAGIKSPEEDLILLLMQGGAHLTSTRWLAPVTQALILPPPILNGPDAETVALKVANAVSFNKDGPGMRTGFDVTFQPVKSQADTEELNSSSGTSWAAPALQGAATAMRLQTYHDLPLQDLSMKDEWMANLDLSLNLWLCADGIDILSDVDIDVLKLDSRDSNPPGPLSPEQVARFAAAWLDDAASRLLWTAYRSAMVEKDLTWLEWTTLVNKARQAEGFTKDLPRRCRSFLWYAENINVDMLDDLEEAADAVDEEDEEDESAAEGSDSKPEKDAAKKAENQEAPHADKLPDQQGDDGQIPEDRNGDKRKPSKPLCEECLQIVQKAKPYDIAFVDVAGNHAEFPHKGARGPDGKFGYVHNATSLRLNPPKFSWPDADLRAACLKRDNHYRMLTEKVKVDMAAHEAAEKSGHKRDKIFCLVYTIDSGHPRIPLIQETWGPKCDGFMVGSNATDPKYDAVDIPHEGLEEYNNIWQKVRSMWSYIYDNYYNDYDWFHIGGDDLYLIVENLRLYLESEEIKTASNGGLYLPDGTETSQVPLFLGRRFAYQGDMNDIFNSGGSGYTLNKAALKLLVVEGFPKLFPHAHTFSEDTMVARVFAQYGVFPYETKDDKGGERYMPFMPGHHYGYRMPKDHSTDWYARYSINIKEGADHCAEHSVAFHYVKGDAMKRLHALLYGMCPADTLSS